MKPILAGLLSFLSTAVLAEPHAAGLGAAAWKEDLAALVTHVTEHHREPFHAIGSEAFDAEVDAIGRSIDAGDDIAVVLGMARLLASIGDGHTRLTLPVDRDQLGFRLGHADDPEPAAGVPRLGVLPVRLRFFGERLHVAAATPEWSRLLGAEVVRVGTAGVDEAVDAVAPWCPHDTPSGLRLMASTRLGIPAVLEAAGLAEAHDAATLTVRTAEGEERARLEALPWGEAVDWVELGATRRPAPAGHEGDWAWLEPLAGGDALYVRLDRLDDRPGGPRLAELGMELGRELRERSPRKVIVDLRGNHGGDGSLARAVVLPLVRWEGSSEAGRLYTLVGPETFSAAVLLLDRLEQWTQNLLVGEEPGSGPASYGDADREVLPHSRLVARVSTRIHVGWTGGESRRRYAVDLPVTATLEDVRSGRDPVLARALADAPAALAERLVRSYDAAGVDTALMVWYRERTDPATADVSTETAMNDLASHVLESGEPGLAAALFALNRGDYPESAAAWRGEAEAQLAAGNRDAAAAALGHALELDPDDPAALSLADRLAE